MSTDRLPQGLGIEKLPPHDPAAEEAVVGSLLIDGEAMFKVATLLKSEDFFGDGPPRWVYKACLSLSQRDESINQVTVARELTQQGNLGRVGGAAYLSNLIQTVPTSVHVEDYARIVLRLSVMRRLISAGGDIAALGYRADADLDATLGRADELLFQVRERQSGRQDFVLLRDALDDYLEETVARRAPEGERPAHLPSGFAALDDLLGGLERSDLIVLAARPGIGKTSLALAIAEHAAVKQQACVAFFSLEMSCQAVAQRLLASQSRVDIRKIRRASYNEQEEKYIMDATGVLSEAAVYIDDTPELRMSDMRNKSLRLNFKRSVDLIVVDYLQLIQAESRRAESRVLEVGEMTRSLKAMARKLNVPVIAVSQLSRAVEYRASHVPVLADLRESGSIEQDADVVMFIHREEVFVKPEEWGRLHDIEREPYPQGIADIIVAKHRNGPTGQVKLRFIPQLASFTNLEVPIG
ncbi:MAG: replicative DNA helicase [Chloroflexota bacterium]